MATKSKTKPATSGGASITFAFANETKGALRYQEIDQHGEAVELDAARIGTLYFRKARFAELVPTYTGEGAPQFLTITIGGAA